MRTRRPPRILRSCAAVVSAALLSTGLYASLAPAARADDGDAGGPVTASSTGSLSEGAVSASDIAVLATGARIPDKDWDRLTARANGNLRASQRLTTGELRNRYSERLWSFVSDPRNQQRAVATVPRRANAAEPAPESGTIHLPNISFTVCGNVSVSISGYVTWTSSSASLSLRVRMLSGSTTVISVPLSIIVNRSGLPTVPPIETTRTATDAEDSDCGSISWNVTQGSYHLDGNARLCLVLDRYGRITGVTVSVTATGCVRIWVTNSGIWIWRCARYSFTISCGSTVCSTTTSREEPVT